MKFGKHIQSQQIPGWASYYLDYKFLKKIISSFVANRPASEAATLALGIRPSDLLSGSSSAPLSNSENPDRPPLFSSSNQGEDRANGFSAHKAAFFFKLERELEKINAFYLQREAELTLRLETLLSKRRAAAMRGLPDTLNGTRGHVEWSAVEEGFRVLAQDLGKLQRYIELNATGFRKILKKWDKHSSSQTKEMYLAREVNIQPVFNRQLIAEMADTVATCLLDVTDLSSGLKFEGRAANDPFTQLILTESLAYRGPFRDLENSLHNAVVASNEPNVRDLLQYADVLAQQDDCKPEIMRILWRVIIESPDPLADFIFSSLRSPFNFDFIDDINGRTCLHEAAIAGNVRLVDVCLEKCTQVKNSDIYGRSALHYASMNGHADICSRLLEAGLSALALDLDNSTPIVYATLQGSVDCVKALLDKEGVTAQSETSLIPLSLASQSGHVDVVMLLLQRGAQCLPNTNGEFPMHLAAREGHAEVCQLLLHQEGWDVPDKYHEWTPLFHAARHGRMSCLKVLLQAGCRTSVVDEFGRKAVHYAAWHGHHACASLLLDVGDTGTTPVNLPQRQRPLSPNAPAPSIIEGGDIDLIPLLDLPPPILPYRAYGHSYLNKAYLVQVAIGSSASRFNPLSRDRNLEVQFHPRLISSSSKDEYLLTSNTLKLVMTTSSDVTSAPYSISLPQREDEGLFSFQISSLDALSLQFSLYPNFGTKTIGRAVAQPSLFSSVNDSASFVLPILDHRLHVIGQVPFEINIVKPFDGVTLEVGGSVETYWKSTTVLQSTPVSPSSSLQHSISVHNSPSIHSALGSPGHSLTVSSLSGDYVYAVVQVTRDLQPVVYSNWRLADVEFNLGVADVTLAQFEALASRSGKHLDLKNTDPQHLAAAISGSMCSLSQLLKEWPSTIGACLELAVPSQKIIDDHNLGHRLDANVFVDAVLRTINAASSAPGRLSRRRKIMFTSFSPNACACVNWKQPNYPVFFGSHCGKTGIDLPSPTAMSLCDGEDQRLSNLAAATEFSKNNNLLGILVCAALLTPIPSLVRGIRAAGLLAGAYGAEKSMRLSSTLADDTSSVDATLSDSVAIYAEHSLLEII